MAASAEERLVTEQEGISHRVSRRASNRKTSTTQPKGRRPGARRARVRVHEDRLRSLREGAALRLPAHARFRSVPLAGRAPRVCPVPDDRLDRADADRREGLTAAQAAGTDSSSTTTCSSSATSCSSLSSSSGSSGAIHVPFAFALRSAAAARFFSSFFSRFSLTVPLAGDLRHRLLPLRGHQTSVFVVRGSAW